MNQPNSLSKGLKTRHMTMISIAGVIGAGYLSEADPSFIPPDPERLSPTH